jgi:hypothetical protein
MLRHQPCLAPTIGRDSKSEHDCDALRSCVHRPRVHCHLPQRLHGAPQQLHAGCTQASQVGRHVDGVQNAQLPPQRPLADAAALTSWRLCCSRCRSRHACCCSHAGSPAGGPSPHTSSAASTLTMRCSSSAASSSSSTAASSSCRVAGSFRCPTARCSSPSGRRRLVGRRHASFP